MMVLIARPGQRRSQAQRDGCACPLGKGTLRQDEQRERPPWVQTAVDAANALSKAGKLDEGVARLRVGAEKARKRGEADWEASDELEIGSRSDARYSHPHFWPPFVLVGDYR